MIDREMQIALAIKISNGEGFGESIKIDTNAAPEDYVFPSNDPSVVQRVSKSIGRCNRGLYYLEKPVIAVPDSDTFEGLINTGAQEQFARSIAELANPMRSFRNSSNNRYFAQEAYAAVLKMEEEYEEILLTGEIANLSPRLGFMMPDIIRFTKGHNLPFQLQLGRKIIGGNVYLPPKLADLQSLDPHAPVGELIMHGETSGKVLQTGYY